MEVKRLHTSGHAMAEQLARLILAVEPKEAICPIHSEYAEGLGELDMKFL